MKRWLLISSLILLTGCPRDGRDGSDGKNGTSTPGATGPSGPAGPAGINGSVPFSYTGIANFPTVTASQTVPGLNLENGSIVNVYISWQGQPWTQIGSTWVGGMAGSYAVVNNVVTITVVIGPLAPQWQWAIEGINKS